MSLVQVTCNFNESPNCRGVYAIGHRAAARNRERNGGKLICLPCSRYVKCSGENNPNFQYNFDRSFFSEIDTEEKAYLLGWIASDGSIEEGQITVAVDARDKYILDIFAEFLNSDLPIRKKKGTNLYYISISSKELVSDACKHLKINPGKKSDCVQFPDGLSEGLSWDFLRGLFDGDGTILKPGGVKRSPQCALASTSIKMRESVSKFFPASHVGHHGVEWYGNRALDFLGHLYDGASYYLSRKKERYLDWADWVPSTSGRGGREATFRWSRTDIRAVAPYKSNASDSGFDLTLIDKVKSWGNVTLYSTGIKVLPDYGWYFDLVGRSSIIKSGYMLANSIGIIDRTYTGEILVPLIKVDNTVPDLELPCRLVQIIPRPIIHMDFVEVEDVGDVTSRGDGGFGSTGVE